ncbi:MAG: DnaD domain protein [Tissierellia bacterium]|nr:DnaD domain protein [Tissierellia bacterium]
MKYRIEKNKVDIGETSIENIFLNQYLPHATGPALKVYLYLYKHAKDPTVEDDLNTKDLSKALQLTEQEIAKSLEYWMEEGILKRDFNVETGENTFYFLSLRELYFGITDPFQYDQRPILRTMDSQKMKEMYDAIESIINLELNTNEMEKLRDHIESTGQSPEIIIMGFQYCAQEKGKKNLNYVLQVLRNWHLDGINTIDDYAAMEKKKEEQKKVQRRKRKYYKPKNNIDKGKRLNDDEDFFLKKLLDEMDD